MPDDDIAFARARNPDKDTVGIKWECPKEIALWLDAECMARGGIDRGPLLNELLGEWADKQRHAHTVRNRMVYGNSPAPDSIVKGAS